MYIFSAFFFSNELMIWIRPFQIDFADWSALPFFSEKSLRCSYDAPFSRRSRHSEIKSFPVV